MADAPAGECLPKGRDRLRQRRAPLDRPEGLELAELAGDVDVLRQDDEIPNQSSERL